MRTVFVTGATGFVGRHLMPALSAALGPDDRLFGTCRHLDEWGDLPGNGLQLDLTDSIEVTNALRLIKPTHVLHLAGYSSPHGAEGEPALTWFTNFGGAANLARSINDFDVRCFIHVSTGEAYGESFLDECPITEGRPLRPLNVYARSKAATESMLSDVVSGDCRLLILRPFNHTGAGQDGRFVVPSFAAQIAAMELADTPERRVIKVGDLTPRRDFLDVADVVDAYVRLIDRSETLPMRATFNIASGEARAIADILDALRRMSMVPFEISVATDRFRSTRIPVASGDPTALQQAVGWSPRISWETTLKHVLDAAREQAGRGHLRASDKG